MLRAKLDVMGEYFAGECKTHYSFTAKATSKFSDTSGQFFAFHSHTSLRVDIAEGIEGEASFAALALNLRAQETRLIWDFIPASRHDDIYGQRNYLQASRGLR